MQTFGQILISVTVSVWLICTLHSAHLYFAGQITSEQCTLCHKMGWKLYNTGWSNKTVYCNFFLTDPKFLKNAITQWFLESLYREVLVFGYFKSVRCMEFCLSESFQYRAFPAPCMAWTLIYTLRRIQTPQTYILFILHLYALRHLLQVSQDKSGQQQTPSDSNRHQTTPTDFPRHPKRPFKDVLCCLEMWRGCLRSFSKRIWVLFMDVCTVSLHLSVYLSVLALYGAVNALYWKSS